VGSVRTDDSTSGTHGRWWLWLGACAALLLVPLVLLVVGLPGDEDHEHAPPPSPNFGMAHVHGLGVDPGDQGLYAATHFGVFRVSDGQAARVGDMQDTMAFTVVGPRTFLASGHPDFSTDDEPLLGLIRSTDAGRTWQSVSLRGEADFHALRVADGRVFGYDSTSGSFLVSGDDGQTWDRRAVLPMRDFAVNPAEPDVVLATTERGLVRSTDGGRSWQSLPAAPALVVLSHTPQALVGVDTTGRLHTSSDAGTTWTALGETGGEPEAITAVDSVHDRRIVVAHSGGTIVESTDGGRSFIAVYPSEG
jgi:photosystem II stability/assembly factor-like uncharacterized protein